MMKKEPGEDALRKQEVRNYVAPPKKGNHDNFATHTSKSIEKKEKQKKQP